jgi:hypothetical protein
MSAKHTPGRLKVDLGREHATLCEFSGSIRGPVVAVVPANYINPNLREELNAEGQANARRLAAAWNACEGIPTKALEAGVIGELVEALLKAVAVLGDAEDEDLGPHIWDWKRQAVAALAKVGG